MPLGGLMTFNIDHGFTEALVRGMRSGFLNDSDYHHLTQCETLEVPICLHVSYILFRNIYYILIIPLEYIKYIIII